MTCAQVGATAEFINFQPVFETKSIGVVVNWHSTLLWIVSHYKWADMEIMLEGTKLLETRGIGTDAARQTIRNTAYVAYFRATGLDMDSQKPPKGDNLSWVQAEVVKQDALLGVS